MAQKLAKLKDVKEGKPLIVKTKEGVQIALILLEGEIYGIENVCPHMEGPVGEGQIEGCRITCPWHGWQFDIKTGACINVEGEEVKKIPVHVENGDIYLSE
jgi:nitrite reductase (NADH) small subunit